MRLQPTQIAGFLSAMEQSFSPGRMQRLLLERFGLQMHLVTSDLKPFDEQVVDVHNYFHQRNTVEQLVGALRDARPAVPEFVALADAMGFTVLPAAAEFEVLVRKAGSPYADVADFRSHLSQLENAVCRVETPGGYGTGVLVGSRLVITNHHVIQNALLADGRLAPNTFCLFDHKKSSGAYATPARRVAVSKAQSFSPPAAEDLQSGAANTDPEKLDYAILELAEDVGSAPLVQGGEPRGFVKIDAGTPDAQAGDVVIVLQHPLAQQMKIDFGAITSTGATRLRHNANTEKGSSGAPLFDRNLNLVAIHHVGLDWPDVGAPYNQGVPIPLIRRHATKNHVDL